MEKGQDGIILWDDGGDRAVGLRFLLRVVMDWLVEIVQKKLGTSFTNQVLQFVF
jgi:hypothetical protein